MIVCIYSCINTHKHVTVAQPGKLIPKNKRFFTVIDKERNVIIDLVRHVITGLTACLWTIAVNNHINKKLHIKTHG